MALIICQDCSKEFSDKATACPNCGCPMDSISQNSGEGVMLNLVQGLTNYADKIAPKRAPNGKEIPTWKFIFFYPAWIALLLFLAALFFGEGSHSPITIILFITIFSCPYFFSILYARNYILYYMWTIWLFITALGVLSLIYEK